MIDIKTYKYFTVKLLESDDMTAPSVPDTANYIVFNNVYETIDMYEMAEIKAVNNAELMNYEKQRRVDQAIEAANLATLSEVKEDSNGTVH
jgi:hypothetical protein